MRLKKLKRKAGTHKTLYIDSLNYSIVSQRAYRIWFFPCKKFPGTFPLFFG